jgi:hypothetical protein
MLQLSKTLHVLVLGFWFGMAVFFSFPVALLLLKTFEGIAQREPRPSWFPLTLEFQQDPAAWKGPATQKPLFENAQQVRKEQGTRAAGAAVGPLFDWYFLLQGACGVLTVATALPWSRSQPHVRAHRVRVIVLLLALVTVVAGWPLERMVSALRDERNKATDALLQTAPDIPDSVYAEAVDARATFGRWHFYSLMLNFGTITLVTVGMALTARLPETTPKFV